MGKPLIGIFLLSGAIIASLYSAIENQRMIDEAVSDRARMPPDLTEDLYLMAKTLPHGGKVFYWTKDRGIVLECNIASLNYHFYPLDFSYNDMKAIENCDFVVCEKSEIAGLDGSLKSVPSIFVFDKTVAKFAIFRKLVISR